MLLLTILPRKALPMFRSSHWAASLRYSRVSLTLPQHHSGNVDAAGAGLAFATLAEYPADSGDIFSAASSRESSGFTGACSRRSACESQLDRYALRSGRLRSEAWPEQPNNGPDHRRRRCGRRRVHFEHRRFRARLLRRPDNARLST